MTEPKTALEETINTAIPKACEKLETAIKAMSKSHDFAEIHENLHLFIQDLRHAAHKHNVQSAEDLPHLIARIAHEEEAHTPNNRRISAEINIIMNCIAESLGIGNQTRLAFTEISSQGPNPGKVA